MSRAIRIVAYYYSCSLYVQFHVTHSFILISLVVYSKRRHFTYWPDTASCKTCLTLRNVKLCYLEGIKVWKENREKKERTKNIVGNGRNSAGILKKLLLIYVKKCVGLSQERKSGKHLNESGWPYSYYWQNGVARQCRLETFQNRGRGWKYVWRRSVVRSCYLLGSKCSHAWHNGV